MTAGAPWSVKGIDPKAREIAKDLARRSGMTLGEWLNHMIVEGEAPTSPDLAHDRAFEAPDEPIAISTPRGMGGMRYEVPGHPADEVGRVAEAMERLTARIEAAEQRSTLAISGIDQSVRGALSRLENAERDQIAIASRFEGALEDLRSDGDSVGERLRRIERDAAGPRSAEALRALEGMMGKVAGQFYESEGRTREAIAGVESRLAQVEKSDPANLVDAVAARVAERLEKAEARTTSALRDMGASFVALDRRLKAVEAGGGAAGGAERLEALAADLTRRLEVTRAELSEKLAASAEARFDRMDRRLSEMAQHIGAAESRSVEAIERMGREMVSMADSFSRKVQGVENRGADAVEQIGGEVARIATAVEQKLSRADTVQAQALEKLGGEIARITEKLSERIANSERRGALAIDEIGEQVARVTERIGQRQERTATDLAERIRQSEERTARLLEEAREKIDASLNSSHRRLVEQVAPAPVVAPLAPPPPARDPFEVDPFPSPVHGFAEEAVAPQAFAQMPPPETRVEPAPFPAPERVEPAFSQEDFDAADGFDPIDEFKSADDFEAADEFVTIDAGPVIPDAPEVPPAPVITPPPAVTEDFSQPRSTREVIEQARLAARAASAPEKPAPQARRGLFNSAPSRERKPKRRAGGSSLQSWVVLLAGTATAAGVGGFGYLAWKGDLEAGGASGRVAEMAQVKAADAKGEIKSGEADTTPSLPQSPRLAIAIAPGLTPTPGAGPAPALAGAPVATATPPAAPTETPASLYADGVRRIKAKDSTGLETLRRAANLGYAPAQFYLSKLYENGEGGLRKNDAEARRWTERAAQGGDPKAMHNLGLAYFHGTGGPTNKTSAAQWFRRAADLGMGDSQYNLASLYEQGYGVNQNAAEAYKWYLIAGRQGDAEARQSADRVKKDLSPEARTAAERSANGFRASSQNASTRTPAVAQANTGVLSAQRALTVLGYYRGPQDGVSSQALKGAVQAFQRDKRLPANGNLDPETLSQLAIYAR